MDGTSTTTNGEFQREYAPHTREGRPGVEKGGLGHTVRPAGLPQSRQAAPSAGRQDSG